MKTARHAKIIEIINKNNIETQEELAKALNEAGFNVTQATVSRDIRELKLTKTEGESGKMRYALLQNQAMDSAGRYVRVLKDAVLSIDTAENILVIKTVSGMAMAAAAALDEMSISEVVGCIAGDNTIMCAIRSVDDTVAVMNRLKKLVED